MRHTKRTSS